MSSLKNDRLIKALFRQPVDRTPIWMMRQAGRYLPEYRATRQQAGSFLTLCKNPELACEVTLQPLRRFDFDAAILFSDILTIPDAMGLGLEFIESKGPCFHHPINNHQDIAKLPIPDPSAELRYVTDAVRLIKQALHQSVPLIGFAGSPWTLACYMVEGSASKNFAKIKHMLYDNPQALHQLLAKLTEATIAYLNAQIDAGVDVVMLFDTWGGILTTSDYQEFSLNYMAQILAALNSVQADRKIPRIIFTKGSSLWLEKMADISVEAIGLDWTIDMANAQKRIGRKVALQGNLDPSVLLASNEVVREKTLELLNNLDSHQGHVFNLGHGITPDVDPEKVATMVKTVQEFII